MPSHTWFMGYMKYTFNTREKKNWSLGFCLGGTSSCRCKEGGIDVDSGIDGRVDPRTETDDRIVLVHYTGTCRGWGMLFESFCWNVTLGGE
jgi:hypothetical protein